MNQKFTLKDIIKYADNDLGEDKKLIISEYIHTHEGADALKAVNLIKKQIINDQRKPHDDCLSLETIYYYLKSDISGCKYKETEEHIMKCSYCFNQSVNLNEKLEMIENSIAPEWLSEKTLSITDKPGFKDMIKNLLPSMPLSRQQLVFSMTYAVFVLLLSLIYINTSNLTPDYIMAKKDSSEITQPAANDRNNIKSDRLAWNQYLSKNDF